jgi:hypothetical protein
LLVNTVRSANHWVEFKLVGTRSIVTELAKITLKLGKRTLVNEVRSGSSYISRTICGCLVWDLPTSERCASALAQRAWNMILCLWIGSYVEGRNWHCDRANFEKTLNLDRDSTFGRRSLLSWLAFSVAPAWVPRP